MTAPAFALSRGWYFSDEAVRQDRAERRERPAVTVSEREVRDIDAGPELVDPGTLQAALEWATARIQPLRALGPNWDSYGALVIDDRAARLASTVLAAVVASRLPIPAIVPTADGGISIEWHADSAELVITAAPASEPPSAYFFSAAGTEWQIGDRFFSDPRFRTALAEFR